MAHAMTTRASASPAFSFASILAIIAAIGSFTVGAGWGLLLAVVAIVLGVIGVVVALLPGVRGGVLSTISVLIGVVGILGAILRIIF